MGVDVLRKVVVVLLHEVGPYASDNLYSSAAEHGTVLRQFG